MPDRSPPSRWTIRAGGLAVAIATLTLMLLTEPRLAIAWDEGYALGRLARLRSWFRALEDPPGFAARWRPPEVELVQQVGARPPQGDQIDTRAELLFEPKVLAWFWPFAREEPHGHPPLYALVGLFGDVVAPQWPDLPRARLGSMLVFSLTAGVLFSFVARRWGPWPGILAASAWGLQPQLFGLAHYTLYDGLLTSLWILSIVAFARAVEPGDPPRGRGPRGGWVVVLGGLFGLAADTKLTGWFLPLPFLAWSLLYRDRRGLLALGVGCLLGLAVLYAVNPPWWGDPIGGVERFLRSNLTRGRTIKIPVLFLGRVVETPNESLPWYNTLVWTLFVTPVGFLALALAGVGRAFRRCRSEPFGMLAVGHWAFLLALRALPHTPGHDGVRQFLPAFGCLALVAGLGAASALERLGRWGKVAIASAIAEGAASVALMMPVPLSYYSPIVGGLPGAAALGMEPTYYWDALSDEALAWLNEHTAEGEKVLFASNPTSWHYLRQVQRLRPEFLPTGRDTWAWYVLQNRPGAFEEWDRSLVERAKWSHVVEKLGVPLIWIFPYAELEASRRSASRRDGPS